MQNACQFVTFCLSFPMRIGAFIFMPLLQFVYVAHSLGFLLVLLAISLFLLAERP